MPAALLTASSHDQALTNAAVEPNSSLSGFWHWIARAERFLPVSLTSDYDFRYRGVLPLLEGFPALSAPSSAHTTPTPSIHSHQRSVQDAFNKGKAHDVYVQAAAKLVSARRVEHLYCVPDSRMTSERKLALQSCGPDWEEPWDVVCERYGRAAQHDRAARHAFLTGHLEATMSHLSRHKNDRMRLLAPIVAAYLAQSEDRRGSDTGFSRLCESLASSAEEPWIRAMFSFLKSGDRQEVIDEGALPLNDRVALAIIFKEDSKVGQAAPPAMQQLLTACSALM